MNKLLFLLFVAIFFNACSLKNNYNPDAEIHDVLQIPQDINYFLPDNPNELLLDQIKQLEKSEEYRKNFLAPWQLTAINKTNLANLEELLNTEFQKRGYGENLRKWTEQSFKLLAENASYKTAPSMDKNAIIIKNTDLRLAPTSLPYFIQPRNAGDAYPFDMFQNSRLPLGFPVKVFHNSKDGQWFYVQAGLISGWILASDLGFVDNEIINFYKNADFGAIINEQTSWQMQGIKTFAKLGAIFPLVRKEIKDYIVAVPIRGTGLTAKMHKIRLSENELTSWPLELTAKNIAVLAEQILGQPYGWGGMYGNRDCSSTLQDLFTPFGIYLPRNSWHQSKQGQIFDLTSFTSKEKEEFILNMAKPFQSFLYLPGHIGLYLGEFGGKAIVLHNIWGIRLENDGRHVIGKNVITSLEPGMEIKKATSSLLDRLKSFNIITK